MEKVAAFIVDKRVIFFAMFAALIVFSVFSSKWVNVETNIISYLSEDTETRQGLTLMEDEFITYGTAQVMVENISADKATALAETLETVEGVSSAGFDAGSEKCYKDSKALFSLTFAYDQSDERCVTALDEAKQALESYDYTLNTEIGTDMSGLIAKECVLLFIYRCACGRGSGSHLHLGYLCGSGGVAHNLPRRGDLNKGYKTFVRYNFLCIKLGDNSVAVGSERGLCHHTVQTATRGAWKKPVREAAISALSKAKTIISSSSLTTIAGLAAMTFMQFRLGLDMGLVLIKAIVCSLFSVFSSCADFWCFSADSWTRRVTESSFRRCLLSENMPLQRDISSRRCSCL